MAALATLADWTWYTFEVCHGMVAGVIHGAVLLTAVGGAIGSASGRLVRGLPIGTLAGVGGALAYELAITVLDGDTYGVAIPAAWIVTWLLLALFEGRWIAPAPRAWLAIVGRGLASAVSSGLAFYLVQDRLWGPAPAEGRNYALQLVAWAGAFAPGMLVLMLRPARKG